MSNRNTFLKNLRKSNYNGLEKLYKELFSSMKINKNKILYEEYSNLKYSIIFSSLKQTEKEKLKDLKVNGNVFIPSYRIGINVCRREENNSSYITIYLKKCAEIFFRDGEFSEVNKKIDVSIIINEDLSLYTDLSKRGLFPATLSDISKILYYFRDIKIVKKIIKNLFQYISEEKKNYLFTEVVEEYFQSEIFLPIKIIDIFQYYNKKQLIQGYLKSENIPKYVNKLSLQKGYLLMKCRRYVLKNEFQKLYVIKNLELNIERTRIKELIIEFFTTYYQYKLGKGSNEDIWVIKEYLELKLSSSNKIMNLKITSLKRMRKEVYDLRIENFIKKNKVKKIKVASNSKFKNLFLGSEFEELTTRRRLVEESLIQNNYCWHYVNAINGDKSRIFSTIYQNNRYTLEIRKSKNKFVLNKLYGANYMSPPNELEENIEKKLKSLSGY